jgi:hypothetical protein
MLTIPLRPTVDLLQLIDHFVDQDKIPRLNDSDFDDSVAFEARSADDEEGDVQMGDAQMRKMVDDFVGEGEVDVKVSEDEDEDEDEEGEGEGEEEIDPEVLEMFGELSKGKGYITEKALRRCDKIITHLLRNHHAMLHCYHAIATL